MSVSSRTSRIACAIALTVSLVSPATMAAAQETTPGTTVPSFSNPDGGCTSLLMMAAGQQGSGSTTGTMNTTTAALSGKVSTPTNQAVPYAMVLSMDPMQGKMLDCKTTDMTGNYSNLIVTSATLVIVSPPKGGMMAPLASSSALVTANAGESLTRDFTLPLADMAIAFVHRVDEQNFVDLNTQFILSCLVDADIKDAPPYACAIARDRSTTTTPYYDARFSSAGVPVERRNNVAVMAMAMIPTATGPLELERFFVYDDPDRPEGMTRLDDLKSLFDVAKAGTDQQLVLTLFAAGSGGGGGGEQGGGLPSSNCAPGETPFLTGTVSSSAGAPGANYVVRLRAYWTKSIEGGGVMKEWVPNWGMYDSDYLVGGDKDGAFSLCRRIPQSPDQQPPSSQMDPSESGYPSSEQPGVAPGGSQYPVDNNMVPVDAEVRFLAVVSPALAPGDRSEAVTALEKFDTAGSTAYRDCILGGDGNTCTLDLATMAPQVQGTVKAPDNRVVPFASLKVYRPMAYSTPEFPTFEYDPFVDATAGDDGWFGLAMNSAAGTVFKVNASAPWCEGTDQQCPFNGLLGTDGFFTAGPNTWAGTESNDTTLTLVGANFRGKLTTPDGTALTGMNLYFRCADDTDQGCAGTETYTNWSDGSFALRLNDGTFDVSVSGGSSVQFIPTDFRVVMTDGAVARVTRTSPGAAVDVCGGTAGSCPDVITLTTAAPNFPIMVRTDEGDPVRAGRVSLEKYVPTPFGYPWSQAGFTETGTDVPRWQGDMPGVPGVAALMIEPDQIYKLRLEPPYMGSSDVSSTEVFVKTATATDGSLTVFRCAKWSDEQMGMGVMPCDKGFNGEGAPGADDLLATEDDGRGGQRYLLTMPTANFKALLCRPGTGPCSPVSDTWVQLEEWKDDPYNPMGGKRWTYGGGTSVNESGNFSMSFTRTGAYKLVLNQPWDRNTQSPDQSLTRTEIYLYVTISDTDGSTTVNYATSEGEPKPTAPESVDGRYVMRYASPSFLGKLVDPATLADPGAASMMDGAWVEVFSTYSDQYCRDCRRYVTGTSVDSSGNFALNIPDGVYTIRANPSPGSEGLSAVEKSFRQFDCEGDGVSELYSADSDGCDAPLTLNQDGRLEIVFGASNFNGTLYNPLVADRSSSGAKVSWSNYYFEVWDNMVKGWRWQNSGGNNTNQMGRFGITFSEQGRYRVTFNAPWNLRAELSDARIVVDVVQGDAGLDAIVDVGASGGPGVVSADGKGGWDVSLARPNVSGRIKSPDGATNLGGAQVNVQKWYQAGTSMCWNEGCWNWSPEVGGTMSNHSDGSFALNLPAGNWRLQVQPPQNNLEYTTTEVELLVDADGTVCRVGPTVDTCPPGSGIEPGAFDVNLGMPNMSGWVVTQSFDPGPDGGPQDDWTGERSRWSSVRFEKWSDVYANWQWVNVWSQTNYQGYFSLNMKENGVYRVNFDPSWQLSDYSYTTKYLAVCAGGAKVAYISQAQAAGWSCDKQENLDAMVSAVSDQIVLRGANVKGYVTSGGVALGDAWISVQTCTENYWGGENCQWVKGVNTPNSNWDATNAGRFNLRIDNEGDEPVKYRIDVSPPWYDTNGLVRQQFDVYFDDFDPGAPGTEYCVGADYQPNASDPNAPGCANPRGDGGTWNIAMTSGNLAGKVITPDAVCPNAENQPDCLGVSGASLGVEKWDTTPWNPDMYGWVWQPLFANSTGSSPTDHEDNGRFGLNIETSGLYRITVNPGWNNPNSYSRASYVISVGSDANWCVNQGVVSNSLDPTRSSPLDSPCAAVSRDNVPSDGVSGFTARLVGSNLSGVLYDSTTDLSSPSDRADNNKKVGDTWMSLSKEVTLRWCWGLESEGQCNEWKSWNWVGSANASSAFGSRGKFGFSIAEPGNYRLEISPSWSNPNATTSFRQDFTVAETSECVAGNSDPSKCAMPADLGTAVLDGSTYLVKYPSPNFVGTVYDKNGPSPVGSDPVKLGGAWLSVFDSQGYWVASTGTVWSGSKKGDFALLLNDGTYRVEIHPPWDQLGAGMRRELQVTVTAGEVSEILVVRGFGATRSLDPFCDDSVSGSECGATLALSLAGPNVNGYLFYPGATDTAGHGYAANTGGNQTVMPWASIQAFKCDAAWDAGNANCNEWAGWFSSQHDGSMQMNLEASGVYRLQIYPNYSLHRSGALQVEVEIVGGAFARWRYLNGADEPDTNGFTPDFGRKKPNVTVTVAGIDAARYLQVYSCAPGSTADTETTAGECVSSNAEIRLLTTKVSGTWKASLYLEPGFYKIGVIRKSGDTTSPTDVADVFEVTADHSENAPALVELDLTALAPSGG